MDDYLACSDLCEEKGFPRQAELMRTIARGEGKVYVVVERGYEYNDEIIDENGHETPRTVYLDREEAERVATRRNAGMYREVNILDYCYDLQSITDLSVRELESRIGQILGRPFTLPNHGRPTFAHSDGPLVPPETTDAQMLQIAELFNLRFYDVVETEFAPSMEGERS